MWLLLHPFHSELCKHYKHKTQIKLFVVRTQASTMQISGYPVPVSLDTHCLWEDLPPLLSFALFPPSTAFLETSSWLGPVLHTLYICTKLLSLMLPDLYCYHLYLQRYYLNIYLVSRTPADLGLTPESLLPPSLLPGTDFGLGADIFLDSVEIQTLTLAPLFCVTYNWRYILQVRVGADGYLNLLSLYLLIINCFETKVFWCQNQKSKIVFTLLL